MLVQLSDLHLRDDGIERRHDPAEALARAFALIAKMAGGSAPGAIIFTGDLIDRSALGYSRVQELLARAPLPLLPIPGNHDRPEAFRAAFGPLAPYAETHLSFVKPLPGYTLIGLDSTRTDGKGGVDAERLGWLRQALATAEGPVILALHHPPFATGIPRLDAEAFTGAEELAALIEGSPVRRLIAGHSHRVIHRQWAGIEASTGPALGYSLALGLAPEAPHAHSAEGPGLHLHLPLEGGFATHLVGLEPGPAEGMRAPLDAAARALLLAP